MKSNSFSELSKSFKAKHIINYIETIKVIEERFDALNNAINKKIQKTYASLIKVIFSYFQIDNYYLQIQYF